MKKTIRNTVIGLALIMVFSAKASDEISLKVSDRENLVVEMKRTGKEAVLSLSDHNGEIIFKDRFFSDSTYKRTLVFDKLPEGEYSLVLDKMYSLSSSIIKKTENGIEIKSESFSFKPIYKVEGKKVWLYLANPAELKMKVEIFDKYGEPVGEFACRDLVLKRTLDFSRVPKGEYVVKIKTPDNKFVKSLKLG